MTSLDPLSVRPTRRRFLRAGAALAVAPLLSRPAFASGAVRRPRPARNVILCIADGVSASHYNLARAFKGAPLCFEPWVCGQLSTRSADAFITDSAAAGSALATGHLTRNRHVSVDDEGRPRRTILESARDAGLATGLVVTGGLTTATAAVFAAHGADRGDSINLARQMVRADLSLMLSGGSDLLAQSLEPGGGATLEDFLRDQGYALPRTASELAAAPHGKIFGQFAAGALFPVVDRPRLGSRQPMLASMVHHALRTLTAHEDGFFLMIEGTQADWAGHQNDPVMLVHELLEFDAAVAKVQEFAARRDDTLVIVLSDHGCGGLVLGNRRSQTERRHGLPAETLVAPLRKPRASAVALWDHHGIRQDPTAANIRRVVRENWRVDLDDGQLEEILAASQDPHRDEDCDGLGRVFSRDFTYLAWTTHEHTAEDVPLFSWGPGAPRGSLHLAEVNAAMRAALNVD